MPASLATAAAVMKEIYLGDIRELLNGKTKTLGRIQKGDTKVINEVGGKYCTFPVHTARNNGVGARLENENLPTAGNQSYTNARFGLVYLYGSIGLSGPTLALVDTDYQAFASALDFETQGIKNDLQVDLNRQLFGDGTGAIAITSSTTSTTTPAITAGIQWMQEGGIYDVYTAANLASAGAAKASGVTVSGIVNSGGGAGSFTVSTAITYTAGDVFVRTGSANREWGGLAAIINNTGTYGNINSTTYPLWKSYVDSTGGALSEGRLITASDAVVAAAGEMVTFMVTTLAVRRSYFNLLSQQRQITNTQDYKGGFTGLAFTTDDGEIPFTSDKDATPGTIWGINEKHLQIYREGDWDWIDRTGTMWQQVSGKDAFTASLYQYSNLGTDKRNAHFKMTGITES